MKETKKEILARAKKRKNDEFYTRRQDIDKELALYEGHFRGKTVYCNCDDPTASNFVAYFRDNFARLGLKRLIATTIARLGEQYGTFYTYDGTKHGEHHRLLVGDGDFRSQECRDFLERSDIVVTNPPFSLMREFVTLLGESRKKFLIVSTFTAVGYRDIFPLIKERRIWLGVHYGKDLCTFLSPASTTGTSAINNCLWLTNLDHGHTPGFLELTKTYAGSEHCYPRYDNMDAINVGKVADIPADYRGVIGVPLTFLHKHNPDQFTIVGFRKGDDGKDLSIDGRYLFPRILIAHTL